MGKRAWEYQRVFYPTPSGEGRVDPLFAEGFFRSAELLLKGVISGELRDGIEGVAAVFLCRHYLELAIKYTLFRSRWLKTGEHNAADSDIKPVGKGHDLQRLWNTLSTELESENKGPNIVPKGLDLAFVAEFVKEFHAVDKQNERFRYPGQQLAVEHSSHETLTINFTALLFNLQHTHIVLDNLDMYLIETHGQNEEWEAIRNSW
jgi:hypothetical protein